MAKHCLSIAHFSKEDVQRLHDRALLFSKGDKHTTSSQKTLAFLFFENSTRTYASFWKAACNLGISVLPLSVSHSSLSKGETLKDMLENLHAMGINGAVIRHPDNHVLDTLAPHIPSDFALINAGDGTHAHPSQALLDWVTLRQYTQPKRLALVGDIRHSRVARSNLTLWHTMGVEDIRLAGPDSFLPDAHEFPFAKRCTSLSDAVQDADVIMTLRVQKERLSSDEDLNINDYTQHYGLTETHLEAAHPNAIVLHPGPINRDIEISASLADHPVCKRLEQARMGVFTRMALLEHCLGNAL